MTATPSGFGDRLAAAMASRGPLCVGVDPSAALLAQWQLGDDADGLRRFCDRVLAASVGRVGVIKPQIAFFERHGAKGIEVLEGLVAAARSAGVLVLLDAKRGDIGSTVEAYAQAYFTPGAPLEVDALTANPYLGFGSLRPLVDLALAHGKGVFVLGRTSNPDGESVQRAVMPDGAEVAASMLAAVGTVNRAAGFTDLGPLGVVFGATVPADGYDLAGMAGPVLAPGVGAQGASAADVGRRFASVARRVLVPVSRGVLSVGPEPGRLEERIDVLSAECRTALGS